MEDLYELVEKDIVKKLRDENLKLKEQVEKQYLELKKVNSSDNTKLISELVAAFNEQSKKERASVIQTLNEIKELNRNTLNNVISETENLESKLDTMVKTLQELIVSISELTEEIVKKDSASEVKNSLNSFLVEFQSSKSNVNAENIEKKLDELEKFMNNLKILLIQLKPSDIK